MDLSELTSPSDCALAIAVPLDRGEFLAGLRPGSSSHFPRWYASRHGARARLDDAVWQSFWEREGERIVALARDVASFGVHVVFQCGLQELGRLASEKTVVTLLAHWHSGALGREDFTDPAEFLARLRDDRHPVLRRLYDVLPVELHSKINAAPGLCSPSSPAFAEFIQATNDVIRAYDLTRPVSTTRRVWPSPTDYLIETNRDALYEAVPDLLVGANGVDLYGGAHRADAIAAVLPPGYAGLLELAVCGSMFLAERIKQRRPNCRLIANRGLTTILFRALVHAATIRELARRPAPYVDVVRRVRVQLWESLSSS